MFKDLCTRYYQKNKEKIKKKSRESCQNLTEQETTESGNMIPSDIKISHKLKDKG